MENQPTYGSQQSKALTITPKELDEAKGQFVSLCKQAQEIELANNAGAAFGAASLVSALRNVLSPAVMDTVFMPLMNTRIGFLTDKDPNKKSKTGTVATPYSRETVRDALIDAIGYGLLPTGNQFNIIADRMYPTKEGFTALLKKISCKYYIQYSTPKVQEATADVDCKINYEWNGEKNSFTYTANVKKDQYSSLDQIKGKAERKAKKALYEYLTGIDFGEADEESSEPIDVQLQEQSVEEKKEALRNKNISETGLKLL